MCTLDVLNVNVNRMQLILKNLRRCLNHIFLLEQLKNYRRERSVTQKPDRGPMTWKDMLENALNDTASWQTRKWSSFSKSQVLASMTIKSSRKNLNQLEIYHRFAYTVFEMLVSGTTCKTRHSVVGQQTCKSCRNMDSGMRQTIGKIEFMHSSHK